MKNIAIVTGASSGIGQGLAINIAKHFDIDQIWIISRRKDRLQKIGRYIYTNYGVNVVAMSLDLTDEMSIQKIKERLEKHNPNISLLVNSSGFGIMGACNVIDKKSQEDMIMLNCKALFSLTHICIPYMSNNSGIIQLSSIAGLCPQPYYSIYSATKAFVLSYSLSLSYELKSMGIHVTTVCPGPVNTEFFDVSEQYSHLKNKIKTVFMKDTKYVVKEIIKGYISKKTVVVPGLTMKLVSIMNGLPAQLISAKLMGTICKDYNKE